MATRQRRQTRQRRSASYGNEYIVGNTVKRMEESYERVPYREPQRQKPAQRSTSPAKRRRAAAIVDTHTSWDLFSLVFMIAALSVMVYFCVLYLQVQHNVVVMNKNIASIESEIMELKNKNDIDYSKVDASIDLAYIYKVATEELGMIHPVENQVFSYQSQKSNYVRQYGDIPKAQD